MATSGNKMVRKQRARRPVEESEDNDNSEERKRVLNVLAQRRYRQRKKERQTALELLAKGLPSPASTQSDGFNDDSCMVSGSSDPVTISTFSADAIADGLSSTGLSPDGPLSNVSHFSENSSDADFTAEPDALAAGASTVSAQPMQNNIFEEMAFDLEVLNTCNATNISMDSLWPSGVELCWDTNNGIMDLSGTPRLINPSTLDSTALTFTSRPVSPLPNFFQTQNMLASSPRRIPTPSPNPDTYTLHLPALSLLRAAHSIATRLNCWDLISDLTASSIFCPLPCSAQHPQQQLDLSWTAHLPLNLQPTKTQLTIPHHPTLDILPWPAVRDKLIVMFSLPPEMWPKHPGEAVEAHPNYSDDVALELSPNTSTNANANATANSNVLRCSIPRLVYDLEDGGVLVNAHESGEETSEAAWEIQQGFVDAWWWCLDVGVLRGANQKRRRRGERGLEVRMRMRGFG